MRQESPRSEPGANRSTRQRADSPHLSQTEVREKLQQIEQTEGQAKRDLMTELAWRPAWAIRSRRGTLRVLGNYCSCLPTARTST